MKAKLIELDEHRAALVARAAAQRAGLSQTLVPWRGRLAVVDEGLVVARYIKNNAALLVGVVALVTPLRPLRRPLRLARWLRRGWVLCRMAVAVKRILPG